MMYPDMGVYPFFLIYLLFLSIFIFIFIFRMGRMIPRVSYGTEGGQPNPHTLVRKVAPLLINNIGAAVRGEPRRFEFQ